ncbi:MAG: hypothetical protein Q8O52_08625 [Sulfuritalea sp.]|jgi:hypothetical protein|nr:hypothetical protein [Sulfuritalea sp.]
MTAPADFRGDGGGREGKQANDTEFRLTDNPRELRALHAALRRSLPREHGDREAGCSNFPDLVAALRRRGLEFPCDRIPDHDRDGKPIRRGVYHLTASDRRKVIRALTRRDKQ